MGGPGPVGSPPRLRPRLWAPWREGSEQSSGEGVQEHPAAGICGRKGAGAAGPPEGVPGGLPAHGLPGALGPRGLLGPVTGLAPPTMPHPLPPGPGAGGGAARVRPAPPTRPLRASSQLVRYSAEGLLQLGPLGSTAFLPDSRCLVDDGRGRTPALRKCEDVARPAQRLWDFTQVSGLLGPRALDQPVGS